MSGGRQPEDMSHSLESSQAIFPILDKDALHDSTFTLPRTVTALLYVFFLDSDTADLWF